MISRGKGGELSLDLLVNGNFSLLRFFAMIQPDGLTRSIVAASFLSSYRSRTLQTNRLALAQEPLAAMSAAQKRNWPEAPARDTFPRKRFGPG
jgi:hypothetical protein